MTTVAAVIHRRWVEAAGPDAGTIDMVSAAIDAALATSRSGTWQVGEAVAQFATLALVERSDDLAGLVASEDARLPVVGQVLHDLPVGLRMSDEARPVWLLDIDGVLNAATKKPDRSVWPADQWIRGHAHDGRHRWPILGARPVAAFIREVHEQGRAEIRWHTTWQDMAKYVGDLLNLPDFPVAESPEWEVHLQADTEEWWKIGAALRVVEEEGRPLVWTDDDLRGAFNIDQATRDRITAARPTLLIGPSDTTGLTPKHLRMINAFLTDMEEIDRAQ